MLQNDENELLEPVCVPQQVTHHLSVGVLTSQLCRAEPMSCNSLEQKSEYSDAMGITEKIRILTRTMPR